MNKVVSQGVKKNLDVSKVYDGMRVVLLCGLGMLLARNNVGNINPMVVAYYSIIYKNKRMRLWGFLSILFGLVTFQPINNISKYVGILVLISGGLYILERVVKEIRTIHMASMALGACWISGIFLSISFATDGDLVILNIVEGIAAFFLTLLYKNGVRFLENRKSSVLTKETLISISMICASALVGMIGFNPAQIPILEIVGIGILLIIGYKYGIKSSAVTGFFIALGTTYLSPINELENFVVWSVVGLVVGLFRELGKAGMLIANSLVFSLLWFVYFPDRPPAQLIEILLISSCIFVVIPIKVKREKEALIELSNDQATDVINTQLNNFSKTYMEIGNLFSSASDVKEGLTNKEINQLIDDVACKVCVDCSMCNICWKNEFYDTYRTVYSVLSAVENRGHVVVEDIPQEFYHKCINADHFITSVNRLFEIYKNNLKWQNKVIENREAFARQFGNIATAVKDLAENVEKDNAYKRRLINTLEEELKKTNIDCVNISVTSYKRENTEIYFELKNSRLSYKKDILRIVNKVGAKKYQFKKEEYNNEKGNLLFVYAEKEYYKLVKGVAKTNKNYEDVSGDVFSYVSMENGLDILALSDGMGSGENAFLESKTAIEILEHLLEGGFDISVAIKTVNSILSVKNDNQMFATLDISTVNRFTGECEFIKNGAVSTLLKRQDKVEVIKNDTLPLGMFKDVDCRRVKKKLRADDIVVMISDGIIDAGNDFSQDEGWIEEALIECESLNPQFIADTLLDIAKRKCDGEPLDDMTVLAFRVWERG